MLLPTRLMAAVILATNSLSATAQQIDQPASVSGVELQWDDDCVLGAADNLAATQCGCPVDGGNAPCPDALQNLWAHGTRRCAKPILGLARQLKCENGKWLLAASRTALTYKCQNLQRYGEGTDTCPYVGSSRLLRIVTQQATPAPAPVQVAPAPAPAPYVQAAPAPVVLAPAPIPPQAANRKKRVLMPVTNWKSVNGRGGPRETGYFLPEVANAYYPFKRAGFEVVFASPKGGVSQVEPFSVDFCPQRLVFALNDDCTKFQTDTEAQQLMRTTISASQAETQTFDAVFYPGGTGLMFDVAGNPTFARISAKVYENGGVVGSVCHGSGALTSIRLSNGEMLVKGKRVTGLSNFEDQIRGNLYVQTPFTVEDKLKQMGANYIAFGVYAPNTVVDGRLITGQNYASTAETARRIIEAMNAK
eukprot:comp12749_c0_seq1/m.7864 comp12749_c0_seq1/g.7864  ORF comp12749_c0_seq1/g.7864 comp12749_c0_seq1/m.7864 type:complete len:419 (-) comp12749_c0_seq1:396-1652(-)